MADIKEAVKEYYGKILPQSDDYKTTACGESLCSMPQYMKEALKNIHKDIQERYFGCGLMIPELLEGSSVLDLGSGAGRDCYMLAQLVGGTGSVTGVDMTREQLDVAEKYLDYHREKFGYKKSNTTFIKGYIEDLAEAGVQDASYDVIVSNCVVNLSTDKLALFREAFRVLKDGGEFYFSDINCKGPVNEELKKNKVLWGEGIAGALCWRDMYNIAIDIGFTAPRVVSGRIIKVTDPTLISNVEQGEYIAVTYRLFKLPANTCRKSCSVTYRGGMLDAEEQFKFDMQTNFKRDQANIVEGDVAAILKNTRFQNHFTFEDTINAESKQLPIDPFALVKCAGMKST